MVDSPGRVIALKVVNPRLHVVVTHADELIWIDAALLEEVKAGRGAKCPGASIIDGDLITFGTPGEGLGLVTYRFEPLAPGQTYHVAERIDP